MKKITLLLLISLLFLHCGPSVEITKESVYLKDRVNSFTDELVSGRVVGQVPPSVRLNDIRVDDVQKIITLVYNRDLSYIPFRKETIERIYNRLSEVVEWDYSFSVVTMDHPIEELVPNFYRDKNNLDSSRLGQIRPPIPFINRTTHGLYENGLSGRNIVLWHSHGWYYSNNEKRWEWQRPRLFQTVEDLIPLSFTVPYLIPMLENAGANIFVPRERDFQANEVVVDNNDKTYIETIYEPHLIKGFGSVGWGHTPIPLTTGINPFKNGSTRFFSSDSVVTAQAEWIPEIPETGNYAVYISYSSSENSADDAHYIVSYYGGTKDFYVNQKMGGGTWIYLGTFKFLKGINSDKGKVTLLNKSNSAAAVLSADAVRFGGGMGVVERDGSTSGRAKFFEAARYWLQYAGMPDTLIYNLNNDLNDYNDDYQSRGEYANYLKGAPSGPNRKRDEKGLGIPIDLSLSFHTDAGIRYTDTVVGTLAIYSIQGMDSTGWFPDSVSRMASRDLTDIIQTEIVNDIRELQDPVWQRRNLWEAQYSESFRPNMPAMLLELLSHQNFLDMQYMLDPRFRFDVSRAIYKGMLKFLSVQHNFDYVVQPLPVNHFSIRFENSNTIKLNWKSQTDPLEPTSSAERYILYTRINDEDFNSGELVYPDSASRTLEPGKLYSFKITALNAGGESFPSEILAAGIPDGVSKGNVLVVNGFDRICGPASVKGNEFAGFVNDIDKGVPDKFDYGFSGRQYDYQVKSNFISNDAPGHGASFADYETRIIAGNSFDYPYIHGKAIINNGFAFVSSSDESFGITGTGREYVMLDYILGEEKETPWQKPIIDSLRGKQYKAFTPDVIEKISDYLMMGGNIFISGAYLGSELYLDTVTAKFAKELLKLKNITSHASRTGRVQAVSEEFNRGYSFEFNTTLNDSIYAVSSPGSIHHTGEGEVLLRYSENQFSAAAGFRKDYGVVGFSFPFETIKGEDQRTAVMNAVLRYFGLRD
jgi:hypothetical protein